MKLVIAFFRLVRWPNLVFIAVTQVLFYYCIVIPVFQQYHSSPALTQKLFWHLVVASVLIAAAGYIINDYFDLNIDRVNKPGKIVVDKIIRRRWAMMWHLIFSFLGILFSLVVALHIQDWHVYLVFILNLCCIGVLWFYSTTYKRRLLAGNILISLLTAWTILILYVVNLKNWSTVKVLSDTKFNYELACTRVFKLAIVYAGFAFIISLIREVIKDMEDREGDAKYGCKTMPIVWGIPATKVFASVWMVVLVSALGIIQFYVLLFGWWISAAYCVLLIILPMIWIIRKLYTARDAKDYHQLSNAVKLVMLAGIVSMLFFKMYNV